MSFGSIRKMIATAVEHEARTGRLGNKIRKVSRKRGVSQPDSNVAALVKGIRGYVESVPVILEAMQNAARQAGIEPVIKPFVKFITDYFENPVDVIPDKVGLEGLIDDAYLARSVVYAASEVVRATTGNPLIPVDLSGDNDAVRRLFDPSTASQLDALIAAGLANPLLTGLAPLLAVNMGGFNQYVNDPMWGNATIDEVVNARLGAMGVI